MLGADVKIFFDGIQTPNSSNDNTLPTDLVTRQGITLLTAFRSISDFRLRGKIVSLVQSVARGTDDGFLESTTD